MGLEELKNIMISEDGEIIEDETGLYRNHSKDIALMIGFLLGVNEDKLQSLGASEDKYKEVIEPLKKNNNALAIRALNNIRSNILLQFKNISQTIRITSANYTPIYNIDFLKNDFKILERQEINIITGRQDLNEYLVAINKEIISRFDSIRRFFPEWVNFPYIRTAFNMPLSDIKAEGEKFQHNQSFYPYKRYINWHNPKDVGNPLLTDDRILDLLYGSAGDHFVDDSKVIDASDHVKDSISEFINSSNKVQIFIDGENVDPYCFASAIESLKDHEIQKINKIIVYYDNAFSNEAWLMLKHFTYDIEVETIGVERLKEDKSLVDHKLVAGVSKAVYAELVDSVIIASSDSDFWSVIEDVDAKYLVMLEENKCGYDYINALRKHDIFYCYLDRFITSKDNKYFKLVFKKSLEFYLNRYFTLGNAKEIFDEAITSTYAAVSPAELQSLYERYIKGLKLAINEENEFEIVIPD